MKGIETPTALTQKEIIELLKTSPEAMEEFEKAYAAGPLAHPDPNDFFATSAKQAKDELDHDVSTDKDVDEICERIVQELLGKTRIWTFDGQTGHELMAVPFPSQPVTPEEINALPEDQRPMLTGDYTTVDIGRDSGPIVLGMYKRWLDEEDGPQKQTYYHAFRQGLDIMDLDPILYAMLGTNPNAMGYWLPQIVDTAVKYLKVPATTIIKVPLALLQLSRLDYERINAVTRKILDEFCVKAFSLDTEKDYFVKTGTYSSKFDFRNAHVPAGKEVSELGEYLMYISNQAVTMAGPLTTPCIYGVSTTNEWVVREYIPDPENCPTIYKGLPLRTEYRFFVDFDKGIVLGVNPYWDYDLMLRRFSQGTRKNPHDMHDFMTFSSHADELMNKYMENVDDIYEKVLSLVGEVHDKGAMTGQWSMDIMQSGNDFWLIDMALAESSALYDNCVTNEMRRPMTENWLPRIPEHINKIETVEV